MVLCLSIEAEKGLVLKRSMTLKAVLPVNMVVIMVAGKALSQMIKLMLGDDVGTETDKGYTIQIHAKCLGDDRLPRTNVALLFIRLTRY